MKDYNLCALQNWDMTDEDVAEEFVTLPKKLLHTPDMNLWITWLVYLRNIEANHRALKKESGNDDETAKRLYLLLAEKNEKGEPKYTKDEAMNIAAINQADDDLTSHIVNMQIIISPRHWYDMDVSYNQYHDCIDGDPEWYLDIEAIKNACRSCFMNNPQEYPGFINDDNGFILRPFKCQGKWRINPHDDYWKSEESMDVYCNRYYNRRAYTPEESFNHLIERFGEDDLPPWADKIRNADDKKR